MDDKNICAQCVCYNHEKQNCKYKSNNGSFKFLNKLINRIFPVDQVSSKPLRRFENGFEWQMTDGNVYVERNISNIRRCSYGVIVSNYLKIKDSIVLDIAPRTARFLTRCQLKLNNCQYYSISGSDNELKKGKTTAIAPEDCPVLTPGSYHAYTSELSKYFKADYFDFIIGTQSFEHWREADICEQKGQNAYEIGLNNCYTILKPGGCFLQDVPIGLHGDNMFISRDINAILELFDSDKWKKVTVTEWGKELAMKRNANKWIGFVKAMKKADNYKDR